jgi:UDP-perosamine 4-acetyltransferase
MVDDVVVVGAGGHASVVIDVLQSAGFRPVVCVGSPNDSGSVLGVPIVAGDDQLGRLHAEGQRHAIVAVGDNMLRSRLAAQAVAIGFELVSAISPRAYVAPSAQVGQGTVVMAGATINARAVLGRNVIANTNSSIDHDCIIGDGAHVAPNVALAGSVRVGARVLVGIGSSLLPGVMIGDDAVVGAGSVVIADVAAGRTVVGVPARPVGSAR